MLSATPVTDKKTDESRSCCSFSKITGRLATSLDKEESKANRSAASSNLEAYATIPAVIDLYYNLFASDTNGDGVISRADLDRMQILSMFMMIGLIIFAERKSHLMSNYYQNNAEKEASDDLAQDEKKEQEPPPIEGWEKLSLNVSDKAWTAIHFVFDIAAYVGGINWIYQSVTPYVGIRAFQNFVQSPTGEGILSHMLDSIDNWGVPYAAETFFFAAVTAYSVYAATLPAQLFVRNCKYYSGVQEAKKQLDPIPSAASTWSPGLWDCLPSWRDIQKRLPSWCGGEEAKTMSPSVRLTYGSADEAV